MSDKMKGEAESTSKGKEKVESAIEGKKVRKQSMIAKIKHMRQALFTNQPLLLLWCKQILVTTNELDVSLPSSVANLLQEYQDVFPEEIPSGLPPIRGIEYQIDLVPGASLPNKPPYKINPEETKEMEQQVHDLLSKGWV